MLQVDHLTLKFGGLIANNDVSMQVQEGKITGLIGPNGAGKTTFFNSISGISPPAAPSPSGASASTACSPTRLTRWACPGPTRLSTCSRK